MVLKFLLEILSKSLIHINIFNILFTKYENVFFNTSETFHEKLIEIILNNFLI